MPDDFLDEIAKLTGRPFKTIAPTTNTRADALKRAADKLGVDAADLGSIISFETGGTLDPHKVGGEGNKYKGLIQFGPAEQKKYYNPKDTFETQVENGVVRYFQDRFKQAGKDTRGATLEDLYTTVIAGNPKANRNAKDSFGTSARSGTQRILKEHRPKVLKDIFGGALPTAQTDDLLDEVAKLTGRPFGKRTEPTNPVNTIPTSSKVIPTPVPETQTTLTSQMASLIDPASTRIGVLLTPGETPPVDLNPSKFRVFDTKNGAMVVNLAQAKKFKLRNPADIQGYLDTNPNAIAQFTGKVETNDDTGSGFAVVTYDKDGNEIHASKVTSSAAAIEQAKLDKNNFKDGVSQKVIPAQKVVADRNLQLQREEIQKNALPGERPYQTVLRLRREPAEIAYKQFLTDTGLTDSDESRKEFNIAQNASIEGANRQNQADVAAYNAQLPKQQRQVTPTTAKPVGETTEVESGDITFDVPLTNKPANVTYSDWVQDQRAEQLANRLNVDYKTVRKVLDSFEAKTKSGTANEAYYAQIAKQGEANKSQIGADVIEKIKAVDAKIKKQSADFDAKLTEYAAELAPGETSSIAGIRAAFDSGYLSEDEFLAQLAKEKDITARLRDEFKQGAALDLTNIGQARLGNGKVGKDFDRDAIQPDVTKALEEIIREYGTLSKYADEQKRLKEEYKYRPLAHPIEFAKNFAGALPKAVASLLKTGDLVLNMNPVKLGADAIAGKGFTIDETVLSELGDGINKYLESVKNKDLKDDPIVTVLPDTLGQMAVQLAAGALTGGATLPTAIGAAMGAAAQYDEAKKFTKDDRQKILAATVGALAAVPDAIAFKSWFKTASPTKLASWLEKTTQAVYARLGVRYGEEVAKETTEKAITVFMRNLLKGSAFEGSQEVSENKINDWLALKTYDPSKAREDKLYSFNKEDKMSFLGGMIGGGSGSVVQTLSEIKTDERDAFIADVNAEVDKMVERGEIKPAKAAEVKAEIVKVSEEVKAKPQAEAKPKITPKAEPKVVEEQVEPQVETKPSKYRERISELAKELNLKKGTEQPDAEAAPSAPSDVSTTEVVDADVAPSIAEADDYQVYSKTFPDGQTWYGFKDPKGAADGAGNQLVATKEDARRSADVAKANAEFRAKAAEAENAKKSAAEQAKQERGNLNGFDAEMTPMRRGKVQQALAKRWNFGKAGAKTAKQFIEEAVADGSIELTTEEVNRIKDMSRMADFRATGEQQRAHEQRVKEGGKVTQYLVNGLELGKTAYDYAKFLLNETDFGNISQSAENKGQSHTSKTASDDAFIEAHKRERQRLMRRQSQANAEYAKNPSDEAYRKLEEADKDLEAFNSTKWTGNETEFVTKRQTVKAPTTVESRREAGSPEVSTTRSESAKPVAEKPSLTLIKSLRDLGYSLPMQKTLSEVEKKDIVDNKIKKKDYVKGNVATQPDVADTPSNQPADVAKTRKLQPQQMGDFIEFFGEDAVIASKALEITLTTRGKGTPNEVKMAGVPYHAWERYKKQLADQGVDVNDIADGTKTVPLRSNQPADVQVAESIAKGDRVKHRGKEYEVMFPPNAKGWTMLRDKSTKTGGRLVRTTSVTKVGGVKTNADVAAKANETVREAKAIAIPRSAAKRYSYAADVAEQINTPEFKKLEAQSATETASMRTGFTKTQTAHLAKALTDYVHSELDKKGMGSADGMNAQQYLAKIKDDPFPLSVLGAETNTETIAVPDDGVIRVSSIQQAVRLHQKITGKPIEGIEKDTKATIPQTNLDKWNAASKKTPLGRPSKDRIAEIEQQQKDADDARKRGISAEAISTAEAMDVPLTNIFKPTPEELTLHRQNRLSEWDVSETGSGELIIGSVPRHVKDTDVAKAYSKALESAETDRQREIERKAEEARIEAIVKERNHGNYRLNNIDTALMSSKDWEEAVDRYVDRSMKSRRADRDTADRLALRRAVTDDATLKTASPAALKADLKDYFRQWYGDGKQSSDILRSVPDTNKLNDIIDDRGNIDYGRAKDVAGRILSGKQEIRRLSPEGERGRIAGGRRNVEASLILGASQAAIQKASPTAGSGVDSHRRQEGILENYAKRNDIWFKQGHFPDRLYRGKGGEANVYQKDDARVIKLVDYRHIDKSMTPLKYLDTRISLFNALFPESHYELAGFMRDDNGTFRVIVTQPLIQGEHLNSPDEVNAMMKARGLDHTESNSYANSLYEVHDLHKGNVVKADNGTIYVIDAVPKAKHIQPFEVVEKDDILRSVPDTVRRQMDAVKEVRNDKGQLLAPNGKVSNLNEYQWKSVRTPNFIEYAGGKDWPWMVKDNNGEPLVTYRGEAEESDILNGEFFTDSPKDASAYAELAALSQAVEQNEELNEIVNDILYEEGGEALTDLGPQTIRDIADANGIDIPSVEGHVSPVYLRMKNPLDLTEFGSDVGSVKDLWNNLHDQGLVDEKWSDLDEDVQFELTDDYRDKALYKFLENEGIQAKAFEKGFDGVIFVDMALEGKRSHTTWLTKQKPQAKSAIGNRGTYSQDEDSILKKTRTTDAMDELETLKQARDFAQIVPKVESSVEDGNVVYLKTSEASEVMRTLISVVEGTARDKQPLLQGLFLTPNRLTDIKDALSALIDESDVDTKPLKSLLSNIEKAETKNGAIKLKVFDEALPHEEAHESSWLGSKGKPYVKRYANADKILSYEPFKRFKQELESRMGMKVNDGVALEEALAYLGTGDLLGVNIDEATEILALLVEGYAEANGVESLQNFKPGTQLYEAIEKRTESQSSKGSDGTRSNVSEGRQTGRETAAAEDQGDAGTEAGLDKASGRDGVTPGKSGLPFDPVEAEKARKLGQKVAAFSRIIGHEYYYDPQNREATDTKAAQLVGKMGVSTAIDQALNGKPSAEGMRVVYWELERLAAQVDAHLLAGRTAEAASVATRAAELAAAIVQRQVAAGQEVEIGKTLATLSPESALIVASRMVRYATKDGKLSTKQSEATVKLANELRKEKAKLAEARLEIAKQRAKIRRLENDRPARKRVTSQDKLLKDYKSREGAILAKLREAFPNSPMFNGSVLRMVAGIRGVQNLPDAKVRQNNYVIAKSMDEAGLDAKRIWLATGWEKGKDGKWRNEIDDSDVVKTDAIKKDATSYLEAPALLSNEIRKAYPYLNNVLFTIEVDPSATYRGSFTRGENRSAEGLSNLQPEITVRAKDVREAVSILLHEVQHAIQEVEGFATGGNARQFEFDTESLALIDRDHELSNILENTARRTLTPAEQKQRDEALTEWTEIQQRLKDLPSQTFDKYQRLAGEVEARNVQLRHYMTPAERAKSALSETEDVPRDKQIVRYGDGVSQSILRSVPDNGVRDALVEYAIGQILQNRTYEAVIGELQDISGLTTEQVKGIHASAVEVLRPARTTADTAQAAIRKIRQEHYKQAKAIDQNIDKKIDPAFKKKWNQNVRELGPIAQEAMKQFPDDTDLVMAVERLTGKSPKNINDVVKDLMGGGRSVPDATQLARKANSLVKAIKEQRAADKAKAEGKLQEALLSEREARIAAQKKAGELRKFLANLAADPNVIKRFNNDFRAKVVLNWGTQIFNGVQAMTIATPAEFALDVLEAGLRTVGVNVGDNVDMSPSLLAPWYVFATDRQMAEDALSHFPEAFYQLHAGLMGDIEIDPRKLAEEKTGLTKYAHQYFDANERLNEFLAKITGAKLQEMHFRNAQILTIFDGVIRSKTKGQESLKSALEHGTFTKYITEKEAQYAVDRALRVTMASQIDDPIGKQLKRAYDWLDNYVPVILNPVTFARFTYTASKVTVINPMLFGAMDSAKLGGQGYNNRSIAKGVLAWSGIAMAYGLQSLLGGDDDKWYTLYIFGKDKAPLDIRRFYPVSAYFYMAHLIRNFKDGRPLPSKSDLLAGFASLELDYFQYGAPMQALSTAGEVWGGTKDWGDLGSDTAAVAASWFAGTTRFFKPMKDVLAQAWDKEAAMREYDESTADKVMKELGKSLPVNALYGENFNVPIKKDMKGNDVITPFPLARMIGVNIVHPSLLSKEDSVATEWANRLFPYTGSSSRMTLEERKAYNARKAIRNAVRSGQDVDIESVLRNMNAKLSDKSLSRLKAELKHSELGAKIKFDFGDNKKDIEALKRVWRHATPSEKDEINSILRDKYKKKSISRDTLDMFDVNK